MVSDTITTTHISIGLAILILVVTALVESASFSAFWLMLNQLQLTSLLALVGVYIPPEIIERIRGVGFASFLFNFIPIIDFIPDGYLNSWIDYAQADDRLASIGLESGSAFVNAFSLIVIVGLLLL